ncbi:MAG: hypothetical protein N2442_00550 [Spirochaetes bacterium]|nr:hypothetical protein [Spirochaetota bacterium]
MKEDPSTENTLSSKEMDPEIADLIGLNEAENEGRAPEFSSLFEEEGSSIDGEIESDFKARAFQRPPSLEGPPKPLFEDKNFYKLILSGEGEVSQRIHQYFSSFLTTQDPQERTNLRSRIITAHWELVGRIALKAASQLPLPRKVFLRYGVLLPTALSPEQRAMLCKIIWENETGEPIFYVDEWLHEVASGRIGASAQDETKLAQRNERQKLSTMVERAKGRFDAQVGLIRTVNTEMEELENRLVERVVALRKRDVRPDINGLKLSYTETQRGFFPEISEILRRLSVLNKDLSRYHTELDSLKAAYEEARKKEEDLGETAVVENKVILEEVNTLRQMAKMCVGRQGNHFPILLKQYLRPNLAELGTRENVLNLLADIEALDNGIFLRTFKQQTNRIVPYILLIPCYGDMGVCWEPFERFNRASGRGRLAIPMYPKDLRVALVAAIGDLRWQMAKEKAQHYWMEEGLTGWYYQWFTERKMKGDVRESFIQDYILWITKESEGTQKLDREVRDIFWRYIPFPQEVKEKLKTRGYVYAELYKKDQNRAMSDGY